MLVLSRKKNQTIVIGDNIEVTVVAISDGRVRLGFKAPREVSIAREEVYCPPAVSLARETTT